jgi:glutamate-5-semialdehyde dehydrogenase
MEYNKNLQNMAKQAKEASRLLARVSSANRTQALLSIADEVERQRVVILQANVRDLEQAQKAGLSKPMCDRLDISGKRFDTLIQAVRDIAAQTDPVGLETEHWDRPNGLKIKKIRQPLGVILMIYEARPNVTLDAAALCLRSGNAVILRGGSEAFATNQALAECIRVGLANAALPETCVQLVPTQERDAIDVLLGCDDDINLVIPRGGEQLIRRVVEKSRIPVVRHYKGICHIFVEAAADWEMALAIVENAKVQRPGVCNAVETVLVDARIAKGFVPQLAERLTKQGVELRGCERSVGYASMKNATPDDWDTEYSDLILAVRVVDGLPEAIMHIDEHGTQHSAAIVTSNDAVAERFVREVDASCVLVNASTRFNDGGELGLGAEMGISTSKVHAYGPMGAQSLSIERFVVQGGGQVRI